MYRRCSYAGLVLGGTSGHQIEEATAHTAGSDEARE